MKRLPPSPEQGAFAFASASAPAPLRVAAPQDLAAPHLLAEPGHAACWLAPRQAPASLFTDRLPQVRCGRCRRGHLFSVLAKVRAATPSASTLLLPDGFRVADLELPERVLVLSLWGRWLDLVLSGDKPLETRDWAWPYPPGWLALFAAKKHDGKLGPGTVYADPIPDLSHGTRGAVVALAWVDASRPLAPADLHRSLVYAPGLYAWPLSRIMRLTRPIVLPRGPQKFSSLPRADLEAALAA